MNKIRELFKEHWPYYLLWLLEIYFTACVFLYCGMDLLDSDISSELILGRLLKDEGGILSKNWCYSTEIRVISIPLAYKLFFYIFNDWQLVHVSGLVFMLLIFMGCYCAFSERMNLGGPGLLCGCVLTVPFSAEYGRFALWNGGYLPHLIFMFLTLALAVKCKSRKANIILLIINCAIALLTGLSGVRYALILYAPFAAAVLFILFYGFVFEGRGSFCEENKQELIHYGVHSLALLAGNAVGLAVNLGIFQKLYVFQDYGGKKLADFMPSMTLDFVARSFNVNFGYTGGPTLFSTEGFVSLCALVFCFICLALIVYACCRFTRHCFEHKLLVAFAVIGFVGNVLICSMSYNIATRYVLMSQVMFFPVFAVALHSFKIRGLKWLNYTVIGTASVCIFVQLAAFCFRPTLDYTYRDAQLLSFAYPNYPILNRRYPADSLKKAAAFLLKSGYKKGFATFWNSNVLTELSDGEIETWTLDFYGDYGNEWAKLRVRSWLQDRRHLEKDPEGKVFLLLQNLELKYDRAEIYTDESRLLYRNKDLSIYGYASAEEMRGALYGKNFMKMMKIKRTGRDSADNSGSEAVVKPGYTLYGPNLCLIKGQYQLLIDCEMEKGASAKCSIVFQRRRESVNIGDFKIAKGLNKIPLNMEWKDGDFKTFISNKSGKSFKVKSMKVIRI